MGINRSHLCVKINFARFMHSQNAMKGKVSYWGIQGCVFSFWDRLRLKFIQLRLGRNLLCKEFYGLRNISLFTLF